MIKLETQLADTEQRLVTHDAAELLISYEIEVARLRDINDDLVDALKHGKSMIKKSMTEGLSSDEKDWIYEVMDAALAKASGEQA